jgi:adenylate cyclase
MSAGNAALKQFAKWRSSPLGVSLQIVLLVFLCTLCVQRQGWLQFLEFHAYDFFIRHQPKVDAGPIVLVEMTEADIHSPTLDWPIYDTKLAELLRILEADQPAIIGLDIWRDIPVPKSGVGIHEFNQVLQTYSNIVAIFTLGGIAPPAVLKTNSDRIAFNDNLIVDDKVDHTIPKVRRSALYGDSASGETFDSFPFRLALVYLQNKGITPEPDPDDAQSIRLGKTRLRQLHPNDGAYVEATIDNFQMLLDFKHPQNFTRYSFVKALSGQIPAGMLRDKIVIVGLNTQSVFDQSVTPIQRNHLGIEVQALVTNQLLRMALNGERPLQFWKDWLEDAWLALWCLTGGALGFWVRSPWKFAATVAAFLVGLMGIVWTAFSFGWWIPAITPALGFIPATALVVSYMSGQERSMRNVLMKLYSRHVSKEIAESIWANRDSFLAGHRPLAQKLVVTVLFTDLKGFSTISEKMEPARLYEWLNGYLGAMAQVIQDYGGVLKQFTGDGILALFGVPVPHITPDQQASDAVAAVKCALAMGRRLVELRREWESEGLPPVSMRAGIYTGEVAAGSVGSDDRFEYAVIGDVVNTASRLESYDKTLADPDLLPNRCRILIGAPTHDLLGGKFQSKEIGLLEVKGKANKVPVFQILDEKRELPTGEHFPHSPTPATVTSGGMNVSSGAR